MAPSRPRAAALDDAGSEASSTRDNKAGNLHQTATTAGVTKRRNNASKLKEAKAALNGASNTHATASAAGPTSAPAKTATTQDPSQSGISWNTVPTSVLHNYRHAYRLPVPSAYTFEHSQMVFSQGLGPQSPTAVFARRKARALAKATAAKTTTTNGASTSTATAASSTTTTATTNAKGKETAEPTTSASNSESSRSKHHRSNIFPDQPDVGRVGKDELALAVRKHFNAMALSEPDAIAKFLYRVREERKGRNLRMRFTAL